MLVDKNVLMIGTNEIDCYFGLAKGFDKQGVRVRQVHSRQMARHYLKEQSFDAILLNLEPDGEGGIGGIESLLDIIDSEKNQDAVCFSISAESATALLTADEKHLATLSVIAGWLTLPVDHQKAVGIIVDIMEASNNLSVKDRLPR